MVSQLLHDCYLHAILSQVYVEHQKTDKGEDLNSEAGGLKSDSEDFTMQPPEHWKDVFVCVRVVSERWGGGGGGLLRRNVYIRPKSLLVIKVC